MGCSTSDQNSQNVEIPPDRYQNPQLLGSGNRGKVFKVLDSSNRVQYAQKIIEKLPDSFDSDSKLEEAKKLFTKISDLKHKNLLQYKKINYKNKKVNIIMQLSEKGTLQSLVSKKGRLEQPVIAIYTKQILEGILMLHNNIILHNNLKPSNIMMFDEDVVKISDFCIQDMFRRGQSNDWINFPFSAPEIVKNIGTFPESDVWSIGCLVIYMLQGQDPWIQIGLKELIYAQITKNAIPPLPFGITVSCQNFLESCLQIVPSQRTKVAELLNHPFIIQNIEQKERLSKISNKQTGKDLNNITNKDIRIKSSKKDNFSLLSQKIVLDDNVITVGQEEVKQKLSSYHPSKLPEIEQTPHIVMLNNKQVKLSPKRYKTHNNYLLETDQTEWISPSRVHMKSFKQSNNNPPSNSLDDLLRNQTSQGNHSAFEKYPQHFDLPNKRLRIQTQPSEYQSKQFFKKPLKLLKKKVLQKKAASNFSRRMSIQTRKLSAADELTKIFEDSTKIPEEVQLSRVNSNSNHEQLVINTEIARAQRYKYSEVQRLTRRKRQEQKRKWQHQLNKGKSLLMEESIYMYRVK